MDFERRMQAGFGSPILRVLLVSLALTSQRSGWVLAVLQENQESVLSSSKTSAGLPSRTYFNSIELLFTKYPGERFVGCLRLSSSNSSELSVDS